MGRRGGRDKRRGLGGSIEQKERGREESVAGLLTFLVLERWRLWEEKKEIVSEAFLGSEIIKGGKRKEEEQFL